MWPRIIFEEDGATSTPDLVCVNPNLIYRCLATCPYGNSNTSSTILYHNIPGTICIFAEVENPFG